MPRSGSSSPEAQGTSWWSGSLCDEPICCLCNSSSWSRQKGELTVSYLKAVNELTEATKPLSLPKGSAQIIPTPGRGLMMASAPASQKSAAVSAS